MEDWLFILITILPFLAAMILLTTFVHEAGHAIAASILTKGKVAIYLGSYGDDGKSVKIFSSKIDIWIRKNIFKWKGGMCRYKAQNISLRDDFIITLAGPIASLILFCILLIGFLMFQPQGMVRPFLEIFCIWSGLTFLYNIVPHNNAIILQKGSLTFNDGTKLERLLQSKKMPFEYNEGIAHYNAQRYEECVVIFDKIIADGTKSGHIYTMAVGAHMKLKNYRRANELQKEQIAKLGNLTTTDRINLALLKTHLGNYEEAIGYYKHLLQTGHKNKYNLNNLGYTLTLIDKFEEAITYLDEAIATDEDFAYAYSNRAFAKMKLGQLKEGKQDNDISLALNKNNGYAYRNTGIYLYETGKYNEALSEFIKSKELEDDIPLVDQYIHLVNQKIG